MSQISEIKIVEREEKPKIPIKVCARCSRTIPYDMRYKRSRKHRGFLCQRCDNELWRAKGYQSERDLCKRLEKLGYSARRVPTSGAGKSDLPDVLVFCKGKNLALAFEVKAYDYLHKSVTVNASQVRVCVQYLQEMYSSGIIRKAGVAVKFLLGERCKSPWIIRLFDVTDDLPLSKIKDVTVDISDLSDMPELTGSTLSRRSRKIRKVRRERKR